MEELGLLVDRYRKPNAVRLFHIAAIISAVAVSTHLRLSALEPEGHGNETPEQIAQEILTGQPAHSEESETKGESNNESEEGHSESEETPEERAAEGK
jgi:hypothetical protein